MERSGRKEDYLILKGKASNIQKKFLKLLQAVQLPENVAIMLIEVHQKVSSKLEKRSDLADREAKQVAKTEVKTEGSLIPDGRISLEGKPEYTKEDQKLITDLEGSYNEKGWAQTPQGKLIIPSCPIWHLVRE